MKRYDCLVPGCTWHAEGKDEAELVRRASEHLQAIHDEAVVRPEMINRIKANIRDGAITN